MKQAKPILHGRDHGPGGSDGIPSTGVTDGSPLVADATTGYVKWGTASSGSFVPELFEVVTSDTLGTNIHDDTDYSMDWIEWDSNNFSFSYTAGDYIIKPDPGDPDYAYFPNPTNFGLFKFELTVVAIQDPQTEPITTPKFWRLEPQHSTGTPGSWSTYGSFGPGNQTVGMLYQHNSYSFVAIPASLSTNEVMWANWYTQFFSGDDYAAVRVAQYQSHPTGVSLDDRQTDITAALKITQVRIPTFPYTP